MDRDISLPNPGLSKVVQQCTGESSAAFRYSHRAGRASEKITLLSVIKTSSRFLTHMTSVRKQNSLPVI